MSWMPHVTVATVVEREGRFLLVEEHSPSSSHLVINQPAGHVEVGETLVEAAIRETLEETGWHVRPTAFLGLYTYTPPSNPESTYYRMCFLAEAVSHEVDRPLDPDIQQVFWLTPDELYETARARSPLVLRCIEDAQRGQSFPLELIYEHPLFIADPSLINA